jgi:hypothetical protein
MDGYLSVNYEFYKAENVWADTNGVVQVSDTIYAMIAGDADGNGIINVLDYAPIQSQLFETGYLMADTDNNGVVNVLDYGPVKNNLFKSNRLPKIYLRQETFPINITASSYVSPYTPDKIIDGFTTENPSSDGWWQSQLGVPHWIQCEFEDSVYIEDIVINFCDRNNGVPRCSLEVSMNGIDWTTIQHHDQWLRFKWNYIDMRQYIKYFRLTNYGLNDPVTDFCVYEIDFYTYVQPGPPPNECNLTQNNNILNPVPQSGGSYNLNVILNGTTCDSWSASSSSWITLNPTNGFDGTTPVSIDVLNNPDTQPRNGVITITSIDANNSPLDIIVNQDGEITTPVKLTIVDAHAKDTSQATTLPWRAYDGVTYTGDVNQIWTSNPIPEWIYFDLGETKTIVELRMSFSYFHEGRVYGYSIEYSDDAINWTTAIASANSVANQEWVTQNVNFSARYVRFSFYSNNQSNWAGFYEVEIYGY